MNCFAEKAHSRCFELVSERDTGFCPCLSQFRPQNRYAGDKVPNENVDANLLSLHFAALDTGSTHR